MNIKVNLLPPFKKEELKNLKIIGAVLKMGAVALFSVVLFVLFLEACIHFIAIQQVALQAESLRFKNNQFYLSSQDSEKVIEEFGEKATKVGKVFRSQNVFWPVFVELNRIMPEELVLDEWQMEKGKIALKGIALKREALISLTEAMEKSEFFEEVESPISNFVSETNAVFEIKAILTAGEKKENNQE